MNHRQPDYVSKTTALERYPQFERYAKYFLEGLPVFIYHSQDDTKVLLHIYSKNMKDVCLVLNPAQNTTKVYLIDDNKLRNNVNVPNFYSINNIFFCVYIMVAPSFKYTYSVDIIGIRNYPKLINQSVKIGDYVRLLYLKIRLEKMII